MPQLRKDPVTREWVIIATERSRRPTDFKVSEDVEGRPSFSEKCPFCPGNESMTPPEVLAYRSADSAPNTAGWWVRVVPNKFPALAIEGSLDRTGFGMYDMMNGIGAHEVICECVEHNRSLNSIPRCRPRRCSGRIATASWIWSRTSGSSTSCSSGTTARSPGASLEHPHSQLIALPMVPQDVMLKIEGAARYYDFHDRCIYCDMLKQETSFGERIVTMNDEFVAFCPFAAKYPFETWIMPRRHEQSFGRMERGAMNAFASICQDVLQRIGVSLNSPPYNFTLHTAPVNQDASATSIGTCRSCRA